MEYNQINNHSYCCKLLDQNDDDVVLPAVQDACEFDVVVAVLVMMGTRQSLDDPTEHPYKWAIRIQSIVADVDVVVLSSHVYPSTLIRILQSMVHDDDVVVVMCWISCLFLNLKEVKIILPQEVQ